MIDPSKMIEGHTLFMQHGSERLLTEAERREFCTAHVVKGQTSIEGSTGFIDIEKMHRKSNGRWMIWGWFTERRMTP